MTVRIDETRTYDATGRVYIADRVSADHERTEPVTRVIEEVTRRLGYFDTGG